MAPAPGVASVAPRSRGERGLMDTRIEQLAGARRLSFGFRSRGRIRRYFGDTLLCDGPEARTAWARACAASGRGRTSLQSPDPQIGQPQWARPTREVEQRDDRDVQITGLDCGASGASGASSPPTTARAARAAGSIARTTATCQMGRSGACSVASRRTPQWPLNDDIVALVAVRSRTSAVSRLAA